MVMAVVTAHILSPYSELEKLLPVKILVLFTFFPEDLENMIEKYTFRYNCFWRTDVKQEKLKNM